MLSWQTTFGWMAVEEEQWRLGRRGKLLRPFLARTGLAARGTSRRLQRVLADFGAEESFARAAERVGEHHGVVVAVSRLRRQTLRHGAQMGAMEMPRPRRASTVLVTEMDGSLIPVVTPSASGADRRKGKQLHWREARLCLARDHRSVSPCYGATLGSTGLAGEVWHRTAVAAGLGDATRVHGVGDGADWITAQFQAQFAAQGTYLVDFWHVGGYLAAAAAAIVPPAQADAWRRRQQTRLRKDGLAAVLRALLPHIEPETQVDTPVRAAHRYLSSRATQLAYRQALDDDLPIGSGEIESAHRHVVQQRLKLAGSWWKEPNAQAMLALRVARANHLWSSYWAHHSSPKN